MASSSTTTRKSKARRAAARKKTPAAERFNCRATATRSSTGMFGLCPRGENQSTARAVSIERKRFIVLTLGDTEAWGYNEQTLPVLLKLVDSLAPDYRMFTHIGVIANYLTSPHA